MHSAPLDQDKASELEKAVFNWKTLREKTCMDYNTKMNHLWLPKVSPCDLKSFMSRALLGWVVKGGYSYRRGGHIGLGFVPVLALAELLTNANGNELKVLVRNPDSPQYRWANIRVLDM